MKQRKVIRNGSSVTAMAIATPPSEAVAVIKTGTMRMAGGFLPPVSANADEPHMQAIMNKENTKPCGSGSAFLDSKAGVQLSTKQYIDPSKADTTMPISDMWRLRHIVRKASVREDRTDMLSPDVAP
eukprot:2245778-Amphidinium_carterae.1